MEFLPIQKTQGGYAEFQDQSWSKNSSFILNKN